MKAFILRRLLIFLPMLLVITFMVHFLMSLSPGSYLDQAKGSRDISQEYIKKMEKQFGLDRPFYERYFLWLTNVFPFKPQALMDCLKKPGDALADPVKIASIFSMDFGQSWTYKVPVSQLLWQRIPATLILSLCSILFAWAIAIPLGVLAAMFKDSLFDRASALMAYAALSLPEFFLALMAVYFASVTGWFPIEGRTSITHELMSPAQQLGDYVHHLVLPTLVLGIGSIASIMRVMRANFLDCIRSEYVTTARAKGMSETTIMFKHVLRNAINPLLSSFGFTLAGLLSGALLVENIMNYPGLGQLVYQAYMSKDEYVVMAAVLIGSIMLMLGNVAADLLLAAVDPRIRLQK